MCDEFIPTKASSVKAGFQYQCVEFETYKPKRHEHSTTEVSSKPDKQNEFNIKKAKHEVFKYGMLGFDHEKKEEAKIQLAIKLGAKPPKNKYKNYKLLKEERTKQKQEEKQKSQFQQLGKNSLGKSTAKKGYNRKKIKSKGILDVYGKVKSNAIKS